MSILKTLKSFFTQFRWLVLYKRAIWHKYFDFTRMNICEKFPLYRPNSAGFYNDLAFISIRTINDIFPKLSSFAGSLGATTLLLEPIENLPSSNDERQAVEQLGKLFEKHGSDKSNYHNYHFVYGCLLFRPLQIRSLLEIGLGTNNTEFVSNMGKFGKPGASLRAFREFLPNAALFGADIDTSILFEEERIKTFFVDQVSTVAFENLTKQLPDNFDLIIDDGLHSPDANIETMKFALPKLAVGGWFVVEDISLEALAFWQVVTALLPENYTARIFRATSTLIYVVQKWR